MQQQRGETLDTAELPLGEILEFLRVIWSLDHGLQALSKRMETKIGVTGPQRLVVRIVGRFPQVPAGQLARILRVHPSTLTGVLARLVKKGLVERKKDPQDGRRVLLSLSNKGRAIDRRDAGTVEDIVKRTLRTIPESKIATARDVLTTLAEALETAARSR